MKKICVVIEDDGSLKVGMEPAGEEMAEGERPEGLPGLEGAMQEDDSYLQPVGSVDELMAKVQELVVQAQGGKMEPGAAQQAAQSEFEAGFKQQRGME